MAINPIELRRDRLESVLSTIQDMELANAVLETESPHAQDHVRLLQAYRGLALTLFRSIRAEESRPLPCEERARIEEECHKATMDHVKRETNLRFVDGGTFSERWDHHVAAQKRFWRALEARGSHRTNCRTCLENTSKEANRWAH